MDSIQQFLTYLKECRKGEIEQSIADASAGVKDPTPQGQGNKQGVIAFFAKQYVEMLFASLQAENFEAFMHRVGERQRKLKVPVYNWGVPHILRFIGRLKNELLRYLPHFTKEVEVAIDVVSKVDSLITSLQLLLIGGSENGDPHLLQQTFHVDQQYKDFFDHAHDLAHV